MNNDMLCFIKIFYDDRIPKFLFPIKSSDSKLLTSRVHMGTGFLIFPKSTYLYSKTRMFRGKQSKRTIKITHREIFVYSERVSTRMEINRRPSNEYRKEN